MKFIINTDEKVIHVEGTVNFKKLFENLKKLLPKDSPFGSWEKYSLVETAHRESIYYYPYYIYQTNWWDYKPQSEINCQVIEGTNYTTATLTNDTTVKLNSQAFIVEMN